MDFKKSTAYDFLFEGKNNEYDEEYKEEIKKVNVENLEKLKKFTNGFQNKSKIDTAEIVREVRGKN
jgi:hypothetical protein